MFATRLNQKSAVQSTPAPWVRMKCSLLRICSASVSIYPISQAVQAETNHDAKIGLYNTDHKTYFDGDFGVGLISQYFVVDFALVNLKNYFNRDNIKLINTPAVYASAGYKFDLGVSLFQPKVAYRTFTRIDDIVDIGCQPGVANQQLLFTAMYHTSKAASFGVGLHYLKKYMINTAYTTQIGNLSCYTAGNFEINLGINW